VSPAEDRYLMTVIATASNPRFSVSRVDVDRGGPTYTIDTLRDLHTARPAAELFFITGADALAQILTWHDAERVFELAQMVGCTRPGTAIDATTLAGLPSDRITILEIPALAISSTECRARAHKGEPVWYLVPDGVVQYIAKRGLYQPATDPSTALADPTGARSRGAHAAAGDLAAVAAAEPFPEPPDQGTQGVP
jgi:nicotinate-nucleotide adenylyltransferase